MADDSEEDYLDDEDLPIELPTRSIPILTPDGSRIQTKISKPRKPAPVFHDTPIEAHIDDDLGLVNHNINNIIEGWTAVRTVEQNLASARELGNQLQLRRKLANKQLGANNVAPMKGVIYHVDDD